MGGRMRTKVAVGTLAVGLAAACGGSPPVTASAGASHWVTADKTITRTHEAPSLLADRGDPNTVYLSEVELQSGQCRFYTSSDGGASWAQGTAPKLAPYTSCELGPAQPQNVRTELRQAPDGTLYYLYQARDPAAGGARSVLLGRSKDRGRSWTVAPVAAAPKATASDPIELDFVAHMAIDPDHPATIYAMWRRSYWNGLAGHSPGPLTRPWMAVSGDSGASFGAPALMFDRNPGFDAPRPLVVGGKLHAFWRESAPPATAATPNPVTTLWSSQSSDRGKTWADSKIAEAPDASEPVPLYDAARKRFDVVWSDNRNHDLDAFFSSSSDAAHWSTPKRLNDDKPGNRAGQFYPQIALAPDGRLDVAWYDFRNDPYPAPKPEGKSSFLNLSANLTRQQDVYHTFSTDGGSTWAPNSRVNDLRIDRTRGTWNGQYFLVVPLSIASSAGHAVVAWSDTRNGDGESATQDIFTGVLAIGPAPADSGTPLGVVVALVMVAGFGAGAGIALLAAGAVLRRRQLRRQPAA